MTTPVAVTRIQNRRGTQDQFNALYPTGYTGIGGFGSIFNTPAATSFATGDGTTATLTLVSPVDTYPVGCTIEVTGLAPVGYNGIHVVTGYTGLTVSFNSTETGPQTVAGTVTKPYTLTNYPGILIPGEIALCTDSRRVFIGNINGEYAEISLADTSNIILTPMVLTLPPAGTYTVIPELTYLASPFFKILYDLTDSNLPDWNTVGTLFSRNGSLDITAIDSTTVLPPPVSPFPPVTHVTLNDVSTEINTAMPNSISFIAQYDATNTLIEILYMHDFSGPLTFSSGTIKWLSY